MTYKIDDLRDHPEFARIVAERVWEAWWRRHGHSLDHLIGLVDLNLDPASSIPFALVAHRDGRFLGTVSVIASDMEARPNLSPWVAALWVDAEYRRDGVGSSLTRQATETAFALGFSPVYLCAAPHHSGFYRRMNWSCIETDVAGLDIFSMTRPGPH